MILTDNEKVFIDRRRRGKLMREYAAEHGISVKELREIEHGRITSTVKPEVKELSVQEKCLLYRIRAEKSQEEVASDLGVSRIWINLMERGHRPVDLLAWYWEQ